MKYPNSFGSVIKLAGRRRKKYAVRISAGYKQRICIPNKKEYLPTAEKYHMQYRHSKNDYVMYIDDDEMKEQFDKDGIPYRVEFVRRFRYLAYFSKSSDAHQYLAKMNRGEPVQEHVSKTSEPDFKTVYNMYIQFAKSLNKPPSKASLHAYNTGFNNWKPVHDIKFRQITTMQLQDCLTKHGTMSRSSVGKMVTILKKMYRFGMAHHLCDEDLTPWLFQEHSDEPTVIHTPFTDEEIERLWNTNSEAAKITLIFIYCGFRCVEFLRLENANIHLDERYLVGGVKTEAGRNRIIPIHKKIDPIIREFYNLDRKYFYPNGLGGEMRYSQFLSDRWNVFQKELGMNHYTHDARHTFATKLEEAGVPDLHRKLIIGHSISDITDGTYTHVSTERLIESIDMWK